VARYAASTEQEETLPAFCPLCASDDHTSVGTTEDGRSYAICASADHGSDGFVWEPAPPPGQNLRGDGLGAELDIWDKLLECVPPDQRVYAYGEVEDRLFEQYPDDARRLLERYGHKWRDPAHPSGQYSMSAYVASRLRELEKEGHLVLTWGPATGPWEHNGTISHWRRA
jgi:hypothetical protein